MALSYLQLAYLYTAVGRDGSILEEPIAGSL